MGSGRRKTAALAALVAALAIPAGAVAAFPGTHPFESPRANGPNDPDFDRCEADDPDTPATDCTSYWSEQYGAFGFSPDSANEVAGLPHTVAATRYADCTQLDSQGQRANRAAGDPACAQISGVRADTAWKYSTGDPRVAVAILDTGIRWQNSELRAKVRLNTAELPKPQGCGSYDCNGDGAINVDDYAGDPGVSIAAGDTESDSLLDASDLIATFSDGTDADGNGFKDDIAGWDFFDDDNDPFDASSCCSANGHGSGRAEEAVAQGNNALEGIGMCPKCQLLPLRVWDTFVVDPNLYAMGVVYAATNGASVVEGAVGGLGNSAFARRAFAYADSRGVALTLVSSDINSANHNYPTNYNEAIYVAGSLPDTAPSETCEGPGSLPGIGDVVSPPDEFQAGCEQLLGILHDTLGISPTLQPITTSFFRNSNLTQYGGKADIVMMGDTGSVSTGQASGAAGLIASYGRQTFGSGNPLTGNEIRQLMTMTAEDVKPANTGEIGLADKARVGWDPHFGYGRLNLAAAMRRIKHDRVPPEAQIDSPDWYAPINVDRVPAGGVPIYGHADAPHSATGAGKWKVEYACGQDARDSNFQSITGAHGIGTVDGKLGTLSKSLLTSLAEHCDGSVRNDPGRPAGTLTDPWPADPYPSPDPERHAFQIRFTAHEAGQQGNFGRYRKTLFAYHDDGNLPGWPKPIGTGSQPDRLVTGSGGEVAPRLYDLNGDNRLDVVLATSSGELYALDQDGDPLASWNGGQPVTTLPYRVAQDHPVPAGVGEPPHETLRTPAIGDLDGDHEADVVATGGEHVYAWHADGTPLDGFPQRIDPDLSDPCLPGAPHPCFDAADRAITSQNHIKRGFIGSAALADLDGDGRLDVVAGSLDAHVYAWDGKGDDLPGFPVKLASEGADGAEIVTSPAIAQLDGGGPPEIVIATNEVVPGEPQFPSSIFDVLNAIIGSATGSNPVYALHGDGSAVDGWPVDVGVLAGDLLPLVLPGHDAAVLDVDDDGTDEVSLTAGTGLLGRLIGGDGSTVSEYLNGVANTLDQGLVLNLADYPSIGDVLGIGRPSVIKGGLTLNGVVNLLASNQNLPFSHVVQAWDPETGLPLPGYPRATDDFQLLTQPAIAKVSAAGPTRSALVGTGLYQLHAYGPGGVEAPGWPKFTGGWIFATPAVGDVDGDGKLEVIDETREGWSFLWNTDAPACATGAGTTTNAEWWTFHHDEHGTANYGTDGRPPATVTDLEADAQPGGAVALSWKAPGDDWTCGTAARYQVIASADPILHPGDGQVVAEGDAAPAGEAQQRTLTGAELGGAGYVALIYRDEAGNWGMLRSLALP